MIAVAVTRGHHARFRRLNPCHTCTRRLCNRIFARCIGEHRARLKKGGRGVEGNAMSCKSIVRDRKRTLLLGRDLFLSAGRPRLVNFVSARSPPSTASAASTATGCSTSPCAVTPSLAHIGYSRKTLTLLDVQRCGLSGSLGGAQCAN